jgi:hypothetical protein
MLKTLMHKVRGNYSSRTGRSQCLKIYVAAVEALKKMKRGCGGGRGGQNSMKLTLVAQNKYFSKISLVNSRGKY